MKKTIQIKKLKKNDNKLQKEIRKTKDIRIEEREKSNEKHYYNR